MDKQDLPLLIPVAFAKDELGQRKLIQITRFEDDSAYIEGAEEIIFEGKWIGSEAPWQSALRYLESHGYTKQT